VVLDLHEGRWQPMVTDHLGSDLLGDVGERASLVGGQLGADYDRASWSSSGSQMRTLHLPPRGVGWI
jgi:hypothetical protein